MASFFSDLGDIFSGIAETAELLPLLIVAGVLYIGYGLVHPEHVATIAQAVSPLPHSSDV